MKDSRITTALSLLYKGFNLSHLSNMSQFPIYISNNKENILDKKTGKSLIILSKKRFILKFPAVFKSLNITSEYLVIPSFENPRWIISTSAKNLGGMMNPTSAKARAAKIMLRIALSLKIGHLIFPHRIIGYQSQQEEVRRSHIMDICESLSVCDGYTSLYLGSFGPLQKTTVEFLGQGEVKFYGKFSDNLIAKGALISELNALKFLSKLSLKNTYYPKVYKYIDINSTNISCLIQTPFLTKEKCEGYTKILSNSLTEIFSSTFNKHQTSLDYFRRIEEKIRALNIDNSRYNMIVLLSKKHIGLDIDIAYSHGDFTRWNIFLDNEKACIFDWEEAEYRPIGYDLFHFHVIESVLVNKKNVIEFYSTVLDICTNTSIFNGFLVKIDTLNLYLELYAVEMITTYLWHSELHQSEGYMAKDNINHMLDFLYSLLGLIDRNNYE